ncbi:MAG: transcription termination/antitermination protein NusA [Candidatus Margulisbacteria bacterium GWF2_38_17]|nr:MAG: transcription termination/antitermination protein NusA [Candidatus Margulisbacteria bacterium GWD2_39_127]OGI01596.1 MAG: transcription termination/antitermination protein NusA [Candidatus Margulisbacteria bacterium GWF2_38_17]OGI10038.1 MAG: transcription termination/antitermination protein NusA [Candidatus Margulisbacteria bacterium GWE2_39_32]
MILIDNFSQVMAQIESERGVDRSVLVRAISDSLLSACKKKFENAENLRVELNELTGETRVFAEKEVIEKVTDEETQISLEEAMEYDDSFKVGDILEIEVTPDDFGRIAAQTAKQVIIQRIREAEKNSIFNEFKGKEGTIISGVVQKLERRNILINLGRIETILGPSDQIPGEIYKPKDRIKLYVVEVRKTPKGPQVVTSRSHPRMLQKLFELEIPEIQDGIIEVKGVSRDPGSRSKIAVKSNNPDIGAVGTCVGKMGSRIQAIIREIGNEKIDIVEWSEDPETLISNALKPAKIARIKIVDLKEKKAEITVPDDQLSLAIGKGGQNVRLAAKLTNWKIDILKLSDIRAVEEQHIKEQEEILIKEVAKRQAEENTLPTEDQE